MIHNAPAGGVYTSIIEAGSDLLKTNCKAFYKGEAHAILPPIFVNKFTEERGKDGLLIPSALVGNDQKQMKLYSGETANQRGEDMELLVHRKIDKMLATENVDFKHLLLHRFNITKASIDVLSAEFPDIKSMIDSFYIECKGGPRKRDIYQLGESDIVVLVQDVGVIAIEIKGSATKLTAGIKQARKLKKLAEIVFTGCAPDLSLPVAKVVVLHETSIQAEDGKVLKQIEDPIKDGTIVWILQENDLKSDEIFKQCWTEILDDLRQKRSNSILGLSFNDFQQMASIMTGLWSMVSFRGQINTKGEVACKVLRPTFSLIFFKSK